MTTRQDRGFRFPMDKYEDVIALYTNFRYLENYLDYIRKRDKYATTIIIASSTSDSPERAHYHCDGVADNVEIQSAINDLTTTGGEITFLEGTYNIASTITGINANLKLSGKGAILNFGTDTQLILGSTSNSEALTVLDGLHITGGTAADSLIRGEGGRIVITGCLFQDITCNTVIGNPEGEAAAAGEWTVVGNHFHDIHLDNTGIGGVTVGAIFQSDQGSGAGLCTFASNIIDTVTRTVVAGASYYVASAGAASTIVVANANIIQNISQLTGTWNSDVDAFHNVVQGTVVAGSHNLSIDDLNDVTITTPADGNILVYDTGGSVWIDETPANVGATIDLNNLGDVVITSPVDGHIIEYDSASGDWVNASPSGGGDLALDDLTDVVISAPQHTQLLQYVVPSGLEVAAFEETRHTSDSTSHINNIPVTEAGQLLVMIHTNDGTASLRPQTVGSGWTQVATGLTITNLNARVYYRIADGTESEGTITITIGGGAEQGVGHIYAINGADLDIPPIEVAEAFQSNDASPDTPTNTPSWGSDQNLFIVACCADDASQDAIGSAPTNYTANAQGGTSTSASAQSCKMMTSYRVVTTASENPDDFTGLNAGDESVTFNIAVQPAADAFWRNQDVQVGELTDVDLTSPAAGDILYFDGTDWINLPAGADGEVLTLAGGVPTWA